MPDRGQRSELTGVELLALVFGVALAVVPGLPFLLSDATWFTRFRNWAIFVGGLLTGAVLARARARLQR